MKISTILKDIFLAFASTLLFGGGIGFLGVWLFNAEISTMLHVSVYIFGVMFVIWFLIDYQEMKNEQALQQAIREEEEKQQRMKEEKQRTISQLEQKYGHCTYVMAPYKKPFATDLVRIYSEARMMVIQGKEYRYDEILSCHISERDINDTAMETHTVTTPDNTHVVRRIAAGAMIGGIKGATLAAFTTRPRTVTTTEYTYHPITRTKYTVVISTTHSPHPISIFMNEDYNRALRLMKQINTARYN